MEIPGYPGISFFKLIGWISMFIRVFLQILAKKCRIKDKKHYLYPQKYGSSFSSNDFLMLFEKGLCINEECWSCPLLVYELCLYRCFETSLYSTFR